MFKLDAEINRILDGSTDREVPEIVECAEKASDRIELDLRKALTIYALVITTQNVCDRSTSGSGGSRTRRD